MSSSDTGSDSEPEFESIIATRARRSNAGSRLRHLLDLEEINSDQTGMTNAINDDDDNVRLLFQEDEEDEEFQESEDSEEDGGEENDDEEGEEEEREGDRIEIDEDNSKEDGNIIENNDEMLSDSDISASDSDEYEGEAELQKQERLNKRRKRNSTLPAALQKKKKQKTESQPKSKPKKSIPKKTNVDTSSIEPYERRRSERRATVKNSIETNEKLEKENERKSTQAPLPKKEYIEKTLEERLEEAKITEKENTLSLTRFYEQEVQKKKKQRDLANSRKIHLDNYLRFWSTGVYVTPLEEVEAIEEEQRIIREEEEKRERRKLVYQKRKMAKLANEREKEKEKEKGKGGDEVEKDSKKSDVIEIKDDTVKIEETEQTKTEGIQDSKASETTNTDLSDGNIEIKQEETDDVESGKNRKVNFSDEVTINGEKVSETTDDKDVEEDGNNIEEEKRIFEGPLQHITRNYLIFEEFEYDLTNEEIKEYLFGKQSLLTGTRRDPLYETIQVIKQDKISNMDLEKIKSNRAESFKELLKLPKFGEKILFDDSDNDKELDKDNQTVHIFTPAPIGIHLPNGQKKICLITGLPAMYYDPNNGVPYATVEAFRILKNISEGEYNWLQLDNGGINSRYKGGIGCYLGKKGQRHAKGVPEWFDK